MDMGNLRQVVVAPSILEMMDRARVREKVGVAHCFYLGTNYLKAQETAAWAGRHGMVMPETSRLFRKACVRAKPRFLELMGRLAERVHSPEWWSIPVSSKSPYLSPFFISIAMLDMVRDYVASVDPAELFLVVESPALADVLESYFRTCESVAVRRTRATSGWSVSWAWKEFSRYLVPRLKFLKDEWMKRRTLGKIRDSLLGGGEPVTLIRSWFFPTSSLNGSFSDVYFEGLARLLEKSGRRPLTVLCLYQPDDAGRLARLVETGDRVVAFDQVVGYWEVVKIFFQTLSPPALGPVQAVYDGVDVSALAEFEIRRRRFDPTRAFAMLHAAFVRQLQRRGIRLDAVYLPFENQPWEKLFCHELRRRYPQAWIGGYQHAVVFDMLLPYHDSPAEVRLAPKPDTILSNGPAYADHFRKLGYPDVRVVYPMRYASLQTNPSPPPVLYDFLVCVPSVYPETLDMMHRLVRLLAGESVRVAVKVHNLIDWKTVIDHLEKIGVRVPDEWEMVSGPLRELIARSNAVMWTSSASYLDALALGKPAVHVVPTRAFDIEWIDLEEGCVHLYPEDSYAALKSKLETIGNNLASDAVRAFVRDRLAFHTPVESVLPGPGHSARN